MSRSPNGRKPKAAPVVEPADNVGTTVLGHPVFAQPDPTPDPMRFEVRHPSDGPAYKRIDALNREHKLQAMPFPLPRGLPEPRLKLAAALGESETSLQRRLAGHGQIVFHAVGDTGNTRGPDSQNLVADKMTADFDEAEREQPMFFLHLGDVVYSFGEAQYYYDQYYDPYRNYPAPILALAGNHDGMVAPGTEASTLAAYVENFCATEFEVTPEAGGLSRTAQIQPGVFFTLEAPFVRIFCLYSNVLEDPGVIADETIGSAQLDYLKAALTRAKAETYAGALIVAHHHPAYTAGSKHGWSVDMTAQIDDVCTDVGLWPHAVLSAHAHNYQRFTRIRGNTQIPYLIAGGGGHGLTRLRSKGGALRTPQDLQNGAGQDRVVLENYDDADYGYLRIVADASQLRIEFHPASDGAEAKTPDDFVTVDLASRQLVHFSGTAQSQPRGQTGS